MSIFFLSYTFPSVSWALVQTRWNLRNVGWGFENFPKAESTSTKSNEIRDAGCKMKSINSEKKFTSASKSQKSPSKQKPSKIDHIVGSLIRDLGAKIQLPELQGFVSSAESKVQYVNNTRLPYESYPLGSQFQEKPLQPMTRKKREGGGGRVAKKFINPVNQRWHLCSKFVPNRHLYRSAKLRGVSK